MVAAGARAFHLLTAGVWLGTGVAILLVFEPSIAASLSELEQEQLLDQVRERWDHGAFFLAPVALLTLVAGWMPIAVRTRLRAVGIGLLAGAALLHRFWLAPSIHALRASLSRRPSLLSPGDPALAELLTMIELSRALFLGQLLLLLLLFLRGATTFGRKPEGMGIEV